MKVKCISVRPINEDNIYLSELTIGKQYEVLRSDEESYFIRNNHMDEVGYYKERFEVVDEAKHVGTVIKPNMQVTPNRYS